MEPYAETQIKDLADSPMRISLSGILISKESDHILLDDSTGQAKIIIDSEKLGEIAENSFIRVLGTKLQSEENLINAEIVQDLSSIDKFLYNKIRNKLLNEKKEEN